MTVRHDAKVHKLEALAWRAYQASVHSDYKAVRFERPHDAAGGGYVDPSARSCEHGAAWLTAYRERDLHCRRRRGA